MKKTPVLAAGLLAAALRGGAEAPAVYALVGARVLPVSRPPLEKGTVVLRDGLVVAVGENVSVPPDARVIDASGLTLTPGIIDGFGGIGLMPPPRPREVGAALPMPAVSPSPGPLAPEAMVLDRLRAADALKARDQGITTALVVAKDGVLPGQSVLVNLSGEKPDEMVLRQPAAMHLHLTALTRQYPNSLMGTVAYVRQALADAAHYREEWAAYEKAPAGRKRPLYDKRLAAWQDVAAGRETLIVTASRENDIRRALALADEFRIRVAVAGAPQASRVADLVKSRGLALLVSVNFDPAKPLEGRGFEGAPDDDEQRREIEDAKRNPAALEKAGVRFALVSGFAPDFLAGVRTAVASGLSKEGALRAVTLGAAEALAVADRTGSLDVGKIANVVAWSGDPLTKDAKVKMVFVDGRLYEPEEKTEPKKEGTGTEEQQ
jgi:imidazolonepropionase-like amidohydrolase